MKNIRLKDLPTFIRTTDITETMFDFLGSEAQNCLNSSAIIFNTFDEFEHEVLEVLLAKFPQVYNIGPLHLLGRHVPESHFMSQGSSLWKEDSKCLQWLDKREPNSVVYVNYGSITVMSDQHLKEFAWGLANSKHTFLWIVRPDVVMGDSAILPEEFFEETKDRGLLKLVLPRKSGSTPIHRGFPYTLWLEFYIRKCICWHAYYLLALLCRATDKLSVCLYHLGDWCGG